MRGFVVLGVPYIRDWGAKRLGELTRDALV